MDDKALDTVARAVSRARSRRAVPALAVVTTGLALPRPPTAAKHKRPKSRCRKPVKPCALGNAAACCSGACDSLERKRLRPVCRDVLLVRRRLLRRHEVPQPPLRRLPGLGGGLRQRHRAGIVLIRTVPGVTLQSGTEGRWPSIPPRGAAGGPGDPDIASPPSFGAERPRPERGGRHGVSRAVRSCAAVCRAGSATARPAARPRGPTRAGRCLAGEGRTPRTP